MEYWDIYDAEKQLTGRTMKRNDWCLKDGEYHLTVLGVVARPDGTYLITKRVMTKAWAPGWWEVSGGAAQAGESSEEAVRREVNEETGLDVSNAEGGYVFTYKREKHMKERIGVTPELFLVAVDKTTGKLAGFLNGIATDEEKFRDEFFTDSSLNNPKGKKVMILGLDVLPEYRGQGLAREIVRCYLQREEEKGRKEIVLTCLDEKVEMYKRDP